MADEDSRAKAGKPRRRGAHVGSKYGTGDSAPRPRKQLTGVGRYAKLTFCERCGQKRGSCSCPSA